MEVSLDGLHCRVVQPNGETIQRAKAFVIDSHLLVVVPDGGKTKLAIDEPIADFARSPRPRTAPHRVSTAAGTYEITEAGCGCGSPLKKVLWRDVIGMRSVSA